MRRMPVKTSIVLSLVYRSDISSITTVFLACQGKSCQLVRCIVLEIIGLKYKYKIKTALKVLNPSVQSLISSLRLKRVGQKFTCFRKSLS